MSRRRDDSFSVIIPRDHNRCFKVRYSTACVCCRAPIDEGEWAEMVDDGIICLSCREDD